MTRAQVITVDEARLSRLLDQRYGDGQIYLINAGTSPFIQDTRSGLNLDFARCGPG